MLPNQHPLPLVFYLQTDLPRLVACRDEEDVLYAGIFELLYCFDDVDDGAAGADADVASFWIEMFLHC